MHCPFCRHEQTQVLDSRTSDGGEVVRRRRFCPACSKRFTSFERYELAMPFVEKSDGTLVAYERQKISNSMWLALRKRKVMADQVEAAIDRIEALIRTQGERQISSKTVGEWVMAELKRLDSVAYVRFASVYRKFEDTTDFEAALREVAAPPSGVAQSAGRAKTPRSKASDESFDM